MRASIPVLLGLCATLANAQFGGVPAYEETDGSGGSGPYKVCEYLSLLLLFPLLFLAKERGYGLANGYLPRLTSKQILIFQLIPVSSKLTSMIMNQA